jgi:hypothetical protein
VCFLWLVTILFAESASGSSARHIHLSWSDPIQLLEKRRCHRDLSEDSVGTCIIHAYTCVSYCVTADYSDNLTTIYIYGAFEQVMLHNWCKRIRKWQSIWRTFRFLFFFSFTLNFFYLHVSTWRRLNQLFFSVNLWQVWWRRLGNSPCVATAIQSPL